MTDLEQKCNEYREYKRLAEQAEQMRDSLRDEIIAMMQGAPEIVAGACKVMYKDVQSVRLDSKLLQVAHPDIYAECARYGINTAGLEPVTISQRRTFTNFGVRMEVKA